MAMEWPHAWIIRRNLQYNIGWDSGAHCRRDYLRVAALRIAWIRDCSVPYASTFSENEDVVAMPNKNVRIPLSRGAP